LLKIDRTGLMRPIDADKPTGCAEGRLASLFNKKKPRFWRGLIFDNKKPGNFLTKAHLTKRHPEQDSASQSYATLRSQGHRHRRA
jgi:hypothetical protein